MRLYRAKMAESGRFSGILSLLANAEALRGVLSGFFGGSGTVDCRPCKLWRSSCVAEGCQGLDTVCLCAWNVLCTEATIGVPPMAEGRAKVPARAETREKPYSESYGVEVGHVMHDGFLGAADRFA